MQQCWEYKKCGREPGGAKTKELGVCPAATDRTHHGKNRGRNAGRYCWRVAGTLCGGKIQGSFAAKYRACMDCEFFLDVKKEEAKGFVL